MIHLPGRFRGRGRESLLDSLAGTALEKTLSREEAQEVVNAATAILDGLKVLLVLADQGHADARLALRQWRAVLERLARSRFD